MSMSFRAELVAFLGATLRIASPDAAADAIAALGVSTWPRVVAAADLLAGTAAVARVLDAAHIASLVAHAAQQPTASSDARPCKPRRAAPRCPPRRGNHPNR